MESWCARATLPLTALPAPPTTPRRGFLKHMERFFSGVGAASAATMVLVTAELLGFYAISTLLLLRCVETHACVCC